MLRLTVSETAFGIVRRFIGLTGGVGAVCARTAVDEKFTVRDLVVIRGFINSYPGQSVPACLPKAVSELW